MRIRSILTRFVLFLAAGCTGVVDLGDGVPTDAAGTVESKRVPGQEESESPADEVFGGGGRDEIACDRLDEEGVSCEQGSAAGATTGSGSKGASDPDFCLYPEGVGSCAGESDNVGGRVGEDCIEFADGGASCREESGTGSAAQVEEECIGEGGACGRG